MPFVIKLDTESNPYPWGEKLIEDAFQSRHNWVVEALVDHKKTPVGWLVASLILDQSELELIVIDSGVRRQGLARRLMITWMTDVAEQGAKEYLLEVRESNLGAIALYKSLGFDLVGRRKNYYEVKQNDQTEQGREAACLFTRHTPYEACLR
ncbi:ribosomal protein S18-alanine N-acetyltransferase [Marinomonas algarum]|uniref:[Ribosomal protein bS18]-alanine N-acetyltransferase n=1 Tax=Marinomonas algarum TaxID=2883105 RepID=A0A9X1LCY1_9GAMM|nr:ribosomal protein S18-alanine N-acetyltransferase [Marinomonas algarum]MCB5162569.1 ribosomal protein S18-alanine N-acetyltransferase [Marinomonas algarum]